MRFTTVGYEQVKQTLAKGTCPICVFMKDYQAGAVRGVIPSTIKALCNFHTWALAAAGARQNTVQVFLDLLRKEESGVTTPNEPCTICNQIRDEEESAVKEFAAELSQSGFKDWMAAHGTLCLSHGSKLLDSVASELQSMVLQIVHRRAGELRDGLMHFLKTHTELQNAPNPGGGILGQVAEFLVSQRGLRK
jgi:hypothetical protein